MDVELLQKAPHQRIFGGMMNVGKGLIAVISHVFDRVKAMKVELNHLRKILAGQQVREEKQGELLRSACRSMTMP